STSVIPRSCSSTPLTASMLAAVVCTVEMRFSAVMTTSSVGPEAEGAAVEYDCAFRARTIAVPPHKAAMAIFICCFIYNPPFEHPRFRVYDLPVRRDRQGIENRRRRAPV